MGEISGVRTDHAAWARSLSGSLEADGFVLSRRAVDAAILDDVKGEVRAIFHQHAPDEDLFAACSRLDAEDKALLYRISETVNRGLAFQRLGLVCSAYLDGFPHPAHSVAVDVGKVMLFGLPDDKRLAYDWHQEANYMPGFAHLANFWMPVFEPATRHNGTMSVLRGSHRLGTLPYTKRKLAANSYTDLVPRGMNEIEGRFEEVHMECEPGDLVLFHSNLIHRSNRNMTPRTRFSAVYRMAFVESAPATFSFSSDKY